MYQAPSKYSVEYLCYRAETRNQFQTQEGEITPKVKKKAKVVILVCDMLSGPVFHYCQVSSKYSKECSTYIVDTKSTHNQCQIKQWEITTKVRKAELSFLYYYLFYSSTRYHQNILKGIPVTEQTRNLFQTKQREIIPRVRKPELSFLYVIRHLVLFYISTKYHKNIPKDL